MVRRIPPSSTASISLINRFGWSFWLRLSSFALSVALLQLGCAGSGPFRPALPHVSAGPTTPTLESVPDWAFASTRGDDANTIVGVGSGASFDQATRHAIRDIASRLSVSVESRVRDVYHEINGTTAESLEQVIEIRVLGTRFSGWERTRSARVDGAFWVEVSIDRGRLVRDSKVELNEIAASVERRHASASGSALARLVVLQSTAEDRLRVSNLVALIDALDPTFDRESWNRRREAWQSFDESARRALIFEVRPDPASQEIARWLESQLASDRFTTRQGSCVKGDSVCIDIRSEVDEANVASRHVTSIRSYFSILEPGGRVVREIDLSGRGNSKSDRARARRRAMDDLRRNLEEKGILSGLIDP